MFAVETETAFSVNRRSLADFLPVEDPVFTAGPVITTSETSAVYVFSTYQVFTSSGTTAQYGVICGNNPVNFTDAFGLCESAVGKVERRMSLIWGALSHGEWGALGKDFESQFREYGEMDPAEFALSFNTMGGATKLYRFGASPESVTRLARKAAEALNSNIGIHGVSVSEQAAVGASSAERAVIEKAFKVHDTPTMRDPLHRTVELPNPVTKAVADMFNRLFGRE